MIALALVGVEESGGPDSLGLCGGERMSEYERSRLVGRAVYVLGGSGNIMRMIRFRSSFGAETKSWKSPSSSLNYAKVLEHSQCKGFRTLIPA